MNKKNNNKNDQFLFIGIFFTMVAGFLYVISLGPTAIGSISSESRH